MSAQDVFGEHLGVIGALSDNYARNEDAAALAGVVRTQQDVAAACEAREEQVKEIVRGGRCLALPPALAVGAAAACRPCSNRRPLQVHFLNLPISAPPFLPCHSRHRAHRTRGGSRGSSSVPR